jgi:hypothetical protein
MTDRSAPIVLTGTGRLTAADPVPVAVQRIRQVIADAASSIHAGVTLAHLLVGVPRSDPLWPAMAIVMARYDEQHTIRIVARIETELIEARARVEARRYSPEARRRVAAVSADLWAGGRLHREIRKHLIWQRMRRERGYPDRPLPPARYPDEGLPL